VKKIRKIKLFLGAVVVIAVALALIMPGSAVVTNTTTIKEKDIDPFWVGKERREIEEAKTWSKDEVPLPVTLTDNIQVSGWAEGDDLRPSITKDSAGRVFITYQNEVGIFESNAGFAFNSDPMDQQAWWDNGVIISLSGVEIILYPDTATCEHPDYELMNVFIGLDTEEAGGMYILDPTDYETWEIYTWTSGAPDPEAAQISDGGWYQDLYYPDIIGPFNFYIYHEIYDVYDIQSCPIYFHTGIDDASGVGYFDAQSFEVTAPSADPDIVNLEDVSHTSIYNTDTNKVIWKKIDPTVETDYEFTPFQATVADGTNPSIAAYGNNVAIVYHDGGQIKCVYSSNDGDDWSQPVTIGPGEYPDVYAQGGMLYAGYVNNGNLYVVSSDDGGITWSSPSKKNDQDGTVVAEENCIDVHSAGIVWVDERNGAYNIYYTTLSSAPDKPLITGPTSGKINREHEFTVTTTDPAGGNVWYFIEWGDSSDSGWLGPYSSGTGVTEGHTWTEEADFTIRAKAKNADDIESEWETFAFSAPKNKVPIWNFLERFPILHNILRNLIF